MSNPEQRKIWLWSAPEGLYNGSLHVDLPGDAPKSEFVDNHKGIHVVILGQAWVEFLELIDLLWIEHMDFPGY